MQHNPLLFVPHFISCSSKLAATSSSCVCKPWASPRLASLRASLRHWPTDGRRTHPLWLVRGARETVARFADIPRLPNGVSPAIQIRAEQILAEKNIAEDQLPQVGKRALVWKKTDFFSLVFYVFIIHTYCENLVVVVDSGPSLTGVLGDSGQSSWFSTRVFLGQAILRTKHNIDTKLFSRLALPPRAYRWPPKIYNHMWGDLPMSTEQGGQIELGKKLNK